MNELGKIPPQAVEMEEAVIGAMLTESESVFKGISILNSECFYKPAHKLIWEAITAIYRENKAIDILTVYACLKSNGNADSAGGVMYLTQLTNGIGSAANIEAHAYVVKECYLKRRLIQINGVCIQKMYNDTVDFFDGFDELLTEIESINKELNRIQQITFSDAVYDRLAQLKEAGESKTYKTGIRTQLDALDSQTMGFQPTDLIIIAARPAMGKTALIIDFMRFQAENNIPVGFFSLEMGMNQIIDRMIASQSGVNLKQIKRGGMNRSEWDIVDTSTLKMMEYPIYVCDKGGLSINDVVGIAKQWKIKHNIQVLYLDYLQLCSGTFKKNGNREQEISEISRRLKQLAKELNIPVIALSQLSRTCESRSDKRPMLSDLRESGAIEQDADMVMFPYREIYYNETYEKPDECEIHIAKYRNGETGKIYVRFNSDTQKFSNLNHNPF